MFDLSLDPTRFPACSAKTLLVADDDAANRDAVLQVMRRAAPSMNVLFAKDGVQALNVLGKRTVHVLLLDWQMPNMSGLELLQILQEQQSFPDLGIVMYTGAMTAAAHLEEALRLGAVDFLRKPAEPLELLARIHSVLQRYDLQQARRQAERLLLEQELLFLKQEVNNYLMLLAQKNQVLSELKERFDQAHQNKETLQPRQLALSLGRLLESSDYWDDLLGKFNRTDPHFLQELVKFVPDISPSETRLAVLIRLGMDNKTIAYLLNISQEGVKKSRYRLRRKIDLEQEEGLEKYLQSL